MLVLSRHIRFRPDISVIPLLFFFSHFFVSCFQLFVFNIVPLSYLSEYHAHHHSESLVEQISFLRHSPLVGKIQTGFQSSHRKFITSSATTLSSILITRQSYSIQNTTSTDLSVSCVSKMNPIRSTFRNTKRFFTSCLTQKRVNLLGFCYSNKSSSKKKKKTTSTQKKVVKSVGAVSGAKRKSMSVSTPKETVGKFESKPIKNAKDLVETTKLMGDLCKRMSDLLESSVVGNIENSVKREQVAGCVNQYSISAMDMVQTRLPLVKTAVSSLRRRPSPEVTEISKMSKRSIRIYNDDHYIILFSASNSSMISGTVQDLMAVNSARLNSQRLIKCNKLVKTPTNAILSPPFLPPNIHPSFPFNKPDYQGISLQIVLLYISSRDPIFTF